MSLNLFAGYLEGRAEREALGSVFDPSSRELLLGKEAGSSKTTTHGGGGSAKPKGLGSRVYGAIKKALSMDSAGGESDFLLDDGSGGTIVRQIEPSFRANAIISGLDVKAVLEMAEVLSDRNKILVVTGATTTALLGMQLINMARNARYAGLAIVVPPRVISEMMGQKHYAVPLHDFYSENDVRDLANELAKMNEAEAIEFMAKEVDPELAAYFDVVGHYVTRAQWQDQHCADAQCI